jgi:FlaA1/EpsC-like NDP-sugar epimerase
MMPSAAAEEWDGKSPLTTQNLKEVDIEDLLPRDKIEVNMDAIGALLTGKKILITGAAGSIGSEMVCQVAVYKPAKMILIDQAETPMHTVRLMMAREFGEIKCKTIVSSIANKKHMEKIFAAHQLDYVFHAAAYKHVPMMEHNPGIAVQNNIYGTRIIADLAVKYGTRKFVMISTDKAVNPTNVMGCSKRICEIYCQSLNRAIVEGKVKGVTQFVTTRFGNVLGSNGSVIPLFREQIKWGGPLTVTHPDIIRFFMLIPEACKLVLEAGTMGKGGEIFVFDMGDPVKIVDLAKRMIRLSGAKDIEIKFTGLRDGEKLFEEVLNDEEQTKPTHHPKIMIASVREYDYETTCQNEIRLLEASRSFDDMAIVKIMKEIVPEYKSKCSKYEVLDKTLNAQLMADILLKINSTH